MVDQLPQNINYQKDEIEDEKILKISYSPLLNSNEEIFKVMFIVEDITKFEILEKEMKEQKEASSRKTIILQELSQSSKEDLSLFLQIRYNFLKNQ